MILKVDDGDGGGGEGRSKRGRQLEATYDKTTKRFFGMYSEKQAPAFELQKFSNTSASP